MLALSRYAYTYVVDCAVRLMSVRRALFSVILSCCVGWLLSILRKAVKRRLRCARLAEVSRRGLLQCWLCRYYAT